MSRRAVQIALFISAGWLLVLVTLVVMITAVRAPAPQSRLVVGWVLAASTVSLGVILGVSVLIVIDTVRSAAGPRELEAAAPPPELAEPADEDELLEEDGPGVFIPAPSSEAEILSGEPAPPPTQVKKRPARQSRTLDT